jgi:hypothetical protein
MVRSGYQTAASSDWLAALGDAGGHWNTTGEPDKLDTVTQGITPEDDIFFPLGYQGMITMGYFTAATAGEGS